MKPPTIDTLAGLAADAIQRDDWDEAERLRVRIERLEDSRTSPKLLPSALWYAAQGMPVFPLKPGTKKPLPRSNGCKDATCDEQQIRAWWSAAPDANIGIATGHLVDVVDIDGPDGQRSRIDYWDAFTMPFLGMVATPRPGGMHLYVPAHDGAGNKAGLLPGIDYRGVGGYVVAPPSRVSRAADPDIKHDGDYHWIAPYDPRRGSCLLHGDRPHVDACWTCRELSRHAAVKAA